jgi:uncharacterized membrane protein
MSIACPECAASMPDDAGYCPGCGRSMRPVERATGRVGALPENIAGALAYFLIPAIIFLFVEPYSRNRFVRFHSLQCIVVYVAAAIVGAALRILGFVLFFIPLLGPLIVGLVSMIVGLGWFILWVVLVLKALQGEMFKLPVAGDFAERQAGTI